MRQFSEYSLVYLHLSHYPLASFTGIPLPTRIKSFFQAFCSQLLKIYNFFFFVLCSRNRLRGKKFLEPESPQNKTASKPCWSQLILKFIEFCKFFIISIFQLFRVSVPMTRFELFFFHCRCIIVSCRWVGALATCLSGCRLSSTHCPTWPARGRSCASPTWWATVPATTPTCSPVPSPPPFGRRISRKIHTQERRVKGTVR